ncbi:acyl-CoA dehydrogenase family protein [Bordetella sp. N]|uniref:acyl-CoA dehydrogenase family protein n=1 Tax=Bordetella sp. N TaxID=1746199 RepID=UPI000ABEBAC7|nr:acyl-CoA dehydrogenase family protein [Bordetella sp. N]
MAITKQAGAGLREQGPDDQSLLARFRPVFGKIAAGALEREETGRRPVEEVRWLKDAGFTAVRVPIEFGGGGATLRQLHLLLIELAAADSNLSHALRVHFRFTEGHWARRAEPHSANWLRRIAAGTVIAAGSAERTGEHGKPATTLTKDKGRYFVTGKKFYTTGSLYADYLSVTGTTEAGEVATLLVRTDAPGVEVIDDWSGIGQRSSSSGTVVFNNAPVEAEEVSPPAPISGSRYAHVQLSHLATAAGIVRRAADDITDFVRARHRTYKQASAAIPAEDPLVQAVVGRADAAAYALKAIVLQVAESLDEVSAANLYLKSAPGTEPEDAALRASLTERVPGLEHQAGLNAYRAQTVALDLALKTTSDIFEVGGSSAVDRHKHLDRHWRNVRTLASHNPLIYRHRHLGEYQLNGSVPSFFAQSDSEAVVPIGDGEALLGV